MAKQRKMRGLAWWAPLLLLWAVGLTSSSCSAADSSAYGDKPQSDDMHAETRGESKGSQTGERPVKSGSGGKVTRIAMGGGSPPPSDLKGLEISVLDIGQGDAILIQMPSGRAVLIDSGPSSDRELLLKQLKLADLKQIDLMVATHPHEDHIGSLAQVLDGWTVKNFTDSGTVHTTVTYRGLMDKLKEKNVPARVARRGQKYKLDPEVFLEVLAPREPLFNGTESDLNNNSTVMRLTYGAFSMVFTGDSEAESETRLVEDGVLTPVTILKVGHHGSRSSSTGPFLDALKPKFAIASLGKGNDYGHPHEKTLKSMSSRGIPFLRTDLEGQIRIITDGKQLWLESFSRNAFMAATDGTALKPSAVQGPISLDANATGGSVGNAGSLSSRPPTTDDEGGSKPTGGKGSGEGKSMDAPAVDEKSAKFLASKKSKVFHDKDCGNGQKISEDNRVYYKRREDALADGKEPAKDCNP